MPPLGAAHPLLTKGHLTWFFFTHCPEEDFLAGWTGPGRRREAHGSPLSPVWSRAAPAGDILPRQAECLWCWSWLLFGPLRSHALPCPGGVDRVAWKSGSATGQVPTGGNVCQERPGCEKAVSSAGDREPTAVTHPFSGPAQKPFLWRQRGVREGWELRSHPGSGPCCGPAVLAA